MPESKKAVGPFELDNGAQLNEEERVLGGGSVRGVRQRASAGWPVELGGNDIGSPSTSPTENVSPSSPEKGIQQNLTPSSQTAVVPSTLTSRQTSPTDPMDGSNTSTIDQGPQALAKPSSSQVTSSLAQESRTGKGLPPQRPPRPSYVPPLLPSDSSNDRFRQLQQQFQGAPPPLLRRKSEEDRPRKSPIKDSSPNTQGEASSPRSNIAELPAPYIAPLNFSQQPRRTPSLGPPPSVRKGAASYYPQSTFVAPILEEISEARSSYASSHVMPSSWGDGPPDYYKGDGPGANYEPPPKIASTTRTVSRLGDDNESASLVGQLNTRQDSRRKKTADGRPFVNEDARNEAEPTYPPRNASRAHPRALTPSSRASAATVELEDTSLNANRGDESGTFLCPPSPNTSPMLSPISTESDARFMTPYSGSPNPDDLRVSQILGNLEKGTALNTPRNVSPLTSIDSVTSDKGRGRPPRLNLNAAREGETRASQTSLPELIRRATRLASNLDRARTHSRVGLMDRLSQRNSRQNSISDILAAFPSPSIGTPRSLRWQSTGKTTISKDPVPPLPEPKSKEGSSEILKGRRCCGMPLWIFILILGILVLLIAAALVIPITLIVLPRIRNKPPSLKSCKTSLPCNNGASNVVVDNSCRCICANGYTGRICSTIADQSCTFADIKLGEGRTVYQNATVGSGIARLFAGAKSQFNIPLDSTRLLSLFSYQNLSCSAESVLITFEGKPQRRSFPLQFVIPGMDLIQQEPPLQAHPSLTIPLTSSTSTLPSQTTFMPTYEPILIPRAGPASSNGIIFAAPTDAPPDTPESTPTMTTTPGTATSKNPKPSSTPSSSSSSEYNSNGIPTKAFDFARTAVLFIFQEKTLSIAYEANSRLQSILSDPTRWNKTVQVAAATILVDFDNFTIDLGNGTIFGGIT